MSGPTGTAPKTPENAQRFLNELDRNDLERLLEHATYQIIVEKPDDWFPTADLHLQAPEPYDEAINSLSDDDRTRILEAIVRTESAAADVNVNNTLHVARDQSRTLTEDQRLFGDLVAERQMLIQVATGGARFNQVDDHYRVRRKRLQRVLEARGLEDPNPFVTLRDWYKRYSSEFGKWAERRQFIRSLYAPLLEKLSTYTLEPVPAREPTGWEHVDRVMEKARADMLRARTTEDFQGVGLLCREMLISLAQAAYLSEKHPTLDGVAASRTDAKRMLEAYIALELAGNADESLRKYARAALELASTLVHKRTATFRFAALCLEASSSVVNTIAIASGRRDTIAFGVPTD